MTIKPLMTTYPRKGALVRDRPLTPFEEDRTPVYVDQLATDGAISVNGTVDIIDSLLTALGLQSEENIPSLFLGSGELRYGIRQKFMTSLRARAMCTFRPSGQLMDSRVASQLERVLERLEVRITEDASGELAMPALPLWVFMQGVMFLDGHQPFCDTDDFKITLVTPSDGLATGLRPDLYVAEQLETVLSRLVVTIYADATNTYALRPIPLLSLRDGFIFPDGTEPFCDDDDFRVEITAASGVPSFLVTSAFAVSAELSLEAVFE